MASRLGTVATAVDVATVNHTLEAGTNRVVIVFVSNGFSQLQSFAPTYGGVAMTAISELTYGTRATVSAFYLLEANLPANGANTVSTSGADAGKTITVVAYEGMDQTPPPDHVLTADPGHVSSTSLAMVPVTSGSVLLSIVSSDRLLGTVTHGTGQTALSAVLNGGGAETVASEEIQTTAANDTQSHSFTNAGVVGQVAFVWAPSAAGLTAGTIAAGSVDQDSAVISESVAASGGTAPYTVQLQKTTRGGTSWSNISGATSLPYTTSHTYAEQYDIRAVYTDSASATANSNTVQVDGARAAIEAYGSYTVNGGVAQEWFGWSPDDGSETIPSANPGDTLVLSVKRRDSSDNVESAAASVSVTIAAALSRSRTRRTRNRYR